MIAPSSPANRTCAFTISRCTRPLPTVDATAVPKVSGATKFQNAAQTTAQSGLSTRVETTVAIELAASCHPFVKSNARLMNTIKTSRWNDVKLLCSVRGNRAATGRFPTRVENGWIICTRSGVFQSDCLDHVGHVLALIRCEFKRFDNLFPLDDLHRVFFLFEKRDDQVPALTVCEVLQTIDLDTVV